jgi:hypothetical protein
MTKHAFTFPNHRSSNPGARPLAFTSDGQWLKPADATAQGYKLTTEGEAKALGVFRDPGTIHVETTAPTAAEIAKARAMNTAFEQSKATRKVSTTQAQRDAEIEAKFAKRFADRAAYLETPAGRAELAAEQARVAQEVYGETVMGLPEALCRPRTALKIAAAHNATSMPISKARLFLAGLPEEPKPEPSTMKADPMAEKTLKRRIEIRMAALNLQADNGSEAARRESNALAYALKLNNGGTDLAAALKMSGANVAAFTN